MNGHRSSINTGGNQLLYKHFNLPDHSVLSMKVRILEKIYHPTNNPNLSTPFRRKREEHWIRQLGTAAPYGCNDHIDSIGNLTSPGCQSVNVLNLFDRTSRRHRSHGARKYNKPEIHNVSFDGLLPFVNLQLGLHYIRTRLYSLPLNMLHDLYESTLTLHFADVASPEHRLQGIILDISSNRLFKAVSVCDYTETKNRPFLKIKFANKGIDALNLRGNECLLVDKWTKWKTLMIFFQSTAIIFSKFDWYHDNRRWFCCMYPVKLYQNLLLKMMARRTKCNNVLEI